MNRFKLTISLVCLTLFLALVGGMMIQPIAFALSDDMVSLPSAQMEQQSSDGEQILLTCKYPVLRSNTGSFFGFEVGLTYMGGTEPRLFDIKVTVPPGFNYNVQRSYGEGEISAVRLEPSAYPENIKINVIPYAWIAPEVGEYPITVEASSGDIKSSIELKAVVSAKYDISVDPVGGRFNVDVTSGKDNYFTIIVSNTGSADFSNVVFNSKTRGAPSDWSITFKPEKIDLLKVGDQREVQVDIKPSSKTIAGDYMVNISAEPESKYAFDSAEMRVTVLTPSIWGWVGVGIVVLVIAGLAVMFVRLGRR